MASARTSSLPFSAALAYAYASTKAPLNITCVVDPKHRMTRASYFLLPDQQHRGTPHFDPSAPREALLFGSIHAPSGCVEALCVTRLSEHWQLMATALSRAPRYPLVPLGRRLGLLTRPERSTTASSSSTTALSEEDLVLGPPGTTNLLLTCQHQTPHSTAEYSYSLDDALWGFRYLRQFSSLTQRGIVSAGAEVFFSAAEKSAGVSIGSRWSMPQGAAYAVGATSSPASPAVATLTLNPMMGHVRASYAAQLDDDVLVSTRYDFNVYSYQSDWTLGAEYRLHRLPEDDRASFSSVDSASSPTQRERVGVCAMPKDDVHMSLRDTKLDPALPSTPVQPRTPAILRAAASDDTSARTTTGTTATTPYLGILKARLSATGLLALLWEGAWHRCLLSVGVKASLSSLQPTPPLLGVEVLYLSDTA